LRRLAVGNVVNVAMDDLIRETQDELDQDVDETRARVAVSVLDRAGLLHRHLDGPRAVELRVGRPGDADEAFRAFADRVRLPRGGSLPLEVAELVERSGVPIQELEPRLLEWQARGWLSYRSAGQNLWIALEPSAPDADRRILDVLDRLE